MRSKLSIIVAMLVLVSLLAGCGATKNESEVQSSNNSSEAEIVENGDDGEVYTLKMSTQLNETSPMVEGFKAWAESVKEKTNGKLLIEVYPSAQLGSDEDVIEPVSYTHLTLPTKRIV